MCQMLGSSYFDNLVLIMYNNVHTVVFQDKAARLVALFQKKRPYSGQAGIWSLDPKTLVRVQFKLFSSRIGAAQDI